MAFSYRVKIPVTASADGAQTNYQMKLTIVKGTGSNTAGTIYLNDHAANWPYDIQFKNASGTVMDYWREEYDATDMTVWVECDSIAASGDTDFYLYYGDSGASDASDGEDTFDLFDHFEGSSIDTYKWNTYGLVSVSGSIVTINGDTSSFDNSRIWAKTAYGTNHAIRFKWKRTLWNNWSALGMGFNANWGVSRNVTKHSCLSQYGNDGRDSKYLRLNTNNGTTEESTTVYSNISTNTDYISDVIRNGSTNVKGYLNTSNSTNTTYLSDTSDEPDFYVRGGSLGYDKKTKLVLDWVLVRNCTLNEPAWASPGSEESAGIDFDSLLFFPRKYRGPDDLSFLELS